MLNICFQMIVFNSDYVLRECLQAALAYGPVIATEGPVRYWQDQGYTTSTDDTNAILDDLKIPTIHGQFEEKDDMVNVGLDRVPPGTDYIWVLDSDEIWGMQEIELVRGALAMGRFDSASFRAHSFYGSLDRVMTGFEAAYDTHRIQRWQPGATWATHRPPTILAPDGRPWRDHRHLDGEELGVKFYHYSYVFPSQMKRKAAYYEDRDPGGVIRDYYLRVYLPWATAHHLGNDDARETIELQFQGVHNWLPARRGPCYTEPFNQHPVVIERNLSGLTQRLKAELSTELWGPT